MPSPRGFTPCVSARLLRRLVLAEGAMVPIETLILAAYGTEAGPSDPRSIIRVALCRLRRKLRAGAIRSHYGEGYSLAADECRRLRDSVGRVDARALVPVETLPG